MQKVTLDAAIKNQEKVTIKTTDGQKYEYSKIIVRGDTLYGIVKGVFIDGAEYPFEMSLSALDIEKITTPNKGVNLAITTVSSIAFTYVIFAFLKNLIPEDGIFGW